jgi:hypothetical protein
MSNNCIPVKTAEEWKLLLADPNKHWKQGYSAWEIAHSWLAVDGFPPEVGTLFTTSAVKTFQKVEMLLGIPEYKVLLPPRRRHPSQNDLFILAREGNNNLISITVEAKVSESFGKTIEKWRLPPSSDKSVRYKFLVEKLGLAGKDLLSIRYQFLHRLASAVIEAERFHAKYAMVIIHSFSTMNKGLDDYKMFLDLFKAKGEVGQLTHLTTHSGIDYYLGWANGNLSK